VLILDLYFCKLRRFLLLGKRLTLDPYINSHFNGVFSFVSVLNVVSCGRFLLYCLCSYAYLRVKESFGTKNVLLSEDIKESL
jgi:hypothetical protein